MWYVVWWSRVLCSFFFQAEDGIRDLVRSRGLGDVYKRQAPTSAESALGSVTAWVTEWFGWFYVLLATAVLVLSLIHI